MKKLVVKRELPSVFCARCRRWVESQERVNSFATVNGVKVPVLVWTCPGCLGEASDGREDSVREDDNFRKRVQRATGRSSDGTK